jgi:tRNA 2-thiouridine synthesizing protein A
MDAATTVDARGTRCPTPVTELAQAIADHADATIVLLADDPSARVDVPVWCRRQRHELVEVAEDTYGAWQFTVRPGTT